MSDAQVAAPKRSRLDGTSGDTVTVACKLPNGLVLQLEDPHDFMEPLPNGGNRPVRQWRRREESYTVRGCALNFEAMKRGMSMPAIEGGYALTSGIPKEFWEQWWDTHRNDDYVRRGLIFAAGSEVEVRREAARNSSVRGLDPIDPDNPGQAGIDVRMVQVGTTSAE